jgi:outer membrane biosynthesis protein TonB
VINYAPTTVLQLLVNGVEQTTFVNSNGNISASINLVSGNNDIQLTATSACGSDTELYNLDFQAGTPNNGTSGGMIQQNQSPTEIKNNSPQNQPAQPKPTPVQPKPVQPTPTKPTTTPTKPTVNPTPTPNKPTTNPAQTPVKPTQPTNPEPVKPTSGGGTNTTTPQQSPQNPSKTETPKGGTTEKGGGK